jgi:putative transposase
MDYRRHYAPGGCYFFTLITFKRRKIFCEDQTLDLLRDAYRQVSIKHPFKTNAAVILPDHIHCVWTLPNSDSNYSMRWRLIKSRFTRNMRTMFPTDFSSGSIWQHRYWEHVIRDELDFRRHIEYIHYNPVKHGYVSAPVDWPHTSFHRFVSRGIYPKDWGSGVKNFNNSIGSE